MSTNVINTDSETNSSTGGSSNMMLLAILAGVVLLAYAPMMFEHFQVLWELEQYQYFPFIIAAVGWLAWTRWQEVGPAEQLGVAPWYRRIVRSLLPIIGVGLAIVTLALAVYFQWEWFAAVSLNLLAGAGLLVLSRHFHVRNAWGIWALMWLLVPPPIEFGANVVQRLQLASSTLSSKTLDLIGINHLMSGNVMTLPHKQLFVDEACSGIVSVMSVIAVTGIYAVWRDRSLLHAGLLMMFSVVWAVVMNTVRICTVAIAEAMFQFNLAEGTPHEILGLVLFLLTFTASISTDQFLEFMLAPIDFAKADRQQVDNRLVGIWNALIVSFTPKSSSNQGNVRTLTSQLSAVLTPRLMACSVPIVGIGVWSALIVFGVLGGRPIPRVNAAALAASVTQETLPAQIGAWKLVAFEASDRQEGDENRVVGHFDFGQYSNQFTYSDGARIATVSIDFPFTGGWHELSACYRANGWTIDQREARSESGREFVETRFSDPTRGAWGYLLFNNFDERGVVVTPPSGAILSRSWLFIRRRLLIKIVGDLYQSQVFVASNSALTEAEAASVRGLYAEISQRFAAHIAAL